MLKIKVDGQQATRFNAEKVVSDAVNFVPIEFIFDARWDGLLRTYQFKNGLLAYDVTQVGDIVHIPHEVLVEGILSVTVKGVILDALNQEILKQGTTSPVTYVIYPSTIVAGANNVIPITPTMYDQILSIANDAVQTANDTLTLMQNYVGPTGPQGIQGVKGDTGPQGAQGIQGIQGDQGIQGLTGLSGADGKNFDYKWTGTKLGVRIGTTGSYDEVDLIGPQGIQGNQGPQGLQGDQGPAGSGTGDMLSSLYATNAKALTGYVDKAINSDSVGGFTVGVSVPADAKFTDTTYTIPTTLPANGGNADTVNNLTVKTAVPTGAVFTDTEYTAGTGLTLTSGAFAPDFGTGSGKVTQGDDARLSDTRTPKTHSHTITDLPAYPTTLPASSASSAVITTGLGYTPLNPNLAIPSNNSASGVVTNALMSGYSAPALNLVYLGTGGKWLGTNATGVATCNGLLGITLEAKTDGVAMMVALPNSFVRNDSWNWTVGATLYASKTVGAMSETIPTGADAIIKVVGFAVTAKTIFFNPSPDQQSVVA